jgi:hypothetical protein
MARYPDVNGIRYDFSSVEINLAGRQVTGVKAVSYKDSLKPGYIRGTSAQKNGRTRGQYDCEASVTLYKAEADDLIASLGAGYKEVSFDVTVHFADVGQSVTTVLIRGARITDEEEEHEEGSEALVVKFSLDPIAVIRNGVAPIRNLNV